MAQTDAGSDRMAAVRMMVIICGLLAIAIAVGWFLAPEKPQAPPASAITYEGPPEKTARRQVLSTESFPREGSVPDAPDGEPLEEPPETEDEYTIVGEVTDARTGDAIPEARVEASRRPTADESGRIAELREAGDTKAAVELLEDLNVRAYGETDENGRYVVTVESPGTYNLAARHAHYMASEMQAELPASRLSTEADFELSQGATIEGRVQVDGTRDGASGVGVTVQGAGRATETDDEGRYLIGGLTPGDYEVSIRLRGTPYNIRGRAPVRKVAVRTVDAVVRGIDFKVAQAGVVWGYVRDGEDNPVPNAGIALVGSESIASQAMEAFSRQKPPMTGQADEKGYYELIGVPLNKEWRVYARPDNMAEQLTDPFVLTPSNREARVDVFVRTGSNVYGRVVDEEGNAVQDAEIQVIPAFSRFFSPVDRPRAFRNDESGEDGLFTLANIPEGDYQIFAFKDGYKISTKGVPIDTDGQRDVRNVRVVLRTAGTGDYTVFGTVRDTSGRAVSGARVQLASFGPGGVSGGDMEATTDSSGHYEITGVESGFNSLNVNAEGYSPKVVTAVRLDGPTDVLLSATGTVTGRVLVRETNRPPENGAYVSAIPMNTDEGANLLTLAAALDPGGVSVSADGTFSISRPPGRYQLQATTTGLTPGKEEVEIVANETESGVTIYVSRGGATLRGMVQVSGSGNPAGALVTISDASAQAGVTFASIESLNKQPVEVGSDGEFVFEQLPEGFFIVAAEHPDYARAESGIVQLGRNETSQPVLLTMGSGGSLEGTVRIRGQLAPGAVVTATGGGVSEATTADQNGRYEFENLPAGEYRVSAVSLESGDFRDAFAPIHGTVSIQEGLVTTYNFGDESMGTVQGLVSPPPGGNEMGFAALVVPGTVEQVLSINLNNPLTMLRRAPDMTSNLVSMAPIQPSGEFMIENAPMGDYDLVIMYANVGEILSNDLRPQYQQPLEITGTEPIDIQVSLN